MGQRISTGKHDSFVSELTQSNKHRTGNIDVRYSNQTQKCDRESLVGSMARFVVLRVEKPPAKKGALDLVCRLTGRKYAEGNSNYNRNISRAHQGALIHVLDLFPLSIRGAFATLGATFQLKQCGMDSKMSPKNSEPRNPTRAPTET
jgi:hypothetical protein